MNLEQQLKDSVLEYRTKFPVETLHREWDNTAVATDSYVIGSEGYCKMIQFASEVMLKNIDVDFWMAIGPKRLEGEEYEDYHIRLRFQKALLKYRAFIYTQPYMTAKKIKKLRKSQQING